MPLHACGGAGGRSRSSPTGGAAKGMPRQLSTPSASSAPRTLPYAVSTMDFDSPFNLDA